MSSVPGVRLSLSSSDPAPTSASGTVVYMLPVSGHANEDELPLWDPVNEEWQLYSWAGQDDKVINGGLTAGKFYDIFVVRSAAGWPNIEVVELSSLSSRGWTPAETDGVTHRGDHECYLGTVYCDGGTLYDTGAKRYCFNQHNREKRYMDCEFSVSPKWSTSSGTASEVLDDGFRWLQGADVPLSSTLGAEVRARAVKTGANNPAGTLYIRINGGSNSVNPIDHDTAWDYHEVVGNVQGSLVVLGINKCTIYGKVNIVGAVLEVEDGSSDAINFNNTGYIRM